MLSAVSEVSRHKCLIYDGHPSEQLPVIVPLLEEGLRANERCLYLGDQLRPLLVRGELVERLRRSAPLAACCSGESARTVRRYFGGETRPRRTWRGARACLLRGGETEGLCLGEERVLGPSFNVLRDIVIVKVDAQL